MQSITLLARGRIDDRDSAFPQATQLPDGRVLCSYSVGGGPNVRGHTEFSESTDNGRSWRRRGVILEKGRNPESCNFLKLSLAADRQTLFAYGARWFRSPTGQFGQGRSEALFCRSRDGGAQWSPPQVIETGLNCPLEVSYGIVPLRSGRLLAPMATLPPERLGERVVTAISDDNGASWPKFATVFHDPDGKCGFFEHKFTEIAPGMILATAWTVTLGSVDDLPNRYALSTDNGESWSPAQSTGTQGQTLSPLALDDGRLLVLYNQRRGLQAIVINLVDFSQRQWRIQESGVLYDQKNRAVPEAETRTGVDAFDDFAFGFPTAIRLQSGEILATYWSREQGRYGISWAILNLTT